MQKQIVKLGEMRLFYVCHKISMKLYKYVLSAVIIWYTVSGLLARLMRKLNMRCTEEIQFIPPGCHKEIRLNFLTIAARQSSHHEKYTTSKYC